MNKIASYFKHIPIGLFAILLLTDVTVFVCEKLGAASAGNAVGDQVAFYLRLLQTPSVWVVIGLAPVQLFLWSTILKKTELSVAYPFTSLCFPVTMLASCLVFHEQISLAAWVGGILITVGVGLVGGLDSDKNTKTDAHAVKETTLVGSAQNEVSH